MIDGFSPMGKHMSLPIRSHFFRQHVSNSGTIDFFYTNVDQVFVRKTISSTSPELNMMLLLAHISTHDFVRLVMYTRTDTMVEMYFPFNTGGDLFDEFNDYTSGGTSKYKIHQFQSRAIQIMIDVATSVKVLHDTLDIVHRDLKMENIFLNSDGSVCIGDFGFACTTNGYQQLTVVGTRAYLSPEMNPGEPYTNPKAADIYALSVMLFVMLVGHFPPWQYDDNGITFGQQSGLSTYYGPRDIKEYTDIYKRLPTPFIAFLTKMLASTPLERPNITIFLQDLTMLQNVQNVRKRLIF